MDGEMNNMDGEMNNHVVFAKSMGLRLLLLAMTMAAAYISHSSNVARSGFMRECVSRSTPDINAAKAFIEARWRARNADGR